MPKAVTQVLVSRPADSPGYTRLLVDPPVGTTQSAALVRSVRGEELVAELWLHGQREFDVPEGCTVEFPDGTVWGP